MEECVSNECMMYSICVWTIFRAITTLSSERKKFLHPVPHYPRNTIASNILYKTIIYILLIKIMSNRCKYGTKRYLSMYHVHSNSKFIFTHTLRICVVAHGNSKPRRIQQKQQKRKRNSRIKYHPRTLHKVKKKKTEIK